MKVLNNENMGLYGNTLQANTYENSQNTLKKIAEYNVPHLQM